MNCKRRLEDYLRENGVPVGPPRSVTGFPTQREISAQEFPMAL